MKILIYIHNDLLHVVYSAIHITAHSFGWLIIKRNLCIYYPT